MNSFQSFISRPTRMNNIIKDEEFERKINELFEIMENIKITVQQLDNKLMYINEDTKEKIRDIRTSIEHIDNKFGYNFTSSDSSPLTTSPITIYNFSEEKDIMNTRFNKLEDLKL